MQQTVLFRLPVWAYKKTIGQLLGPKAEEVELGGTESSSNSDAEAEDVVSKAKGSARKRNKRNGKGR